MVRDNASGQFLERRHGEPFPAPQRRTGFSQDGTVVAGSSIGELVDEACSTFDVVIIEAAPVIRVAATLILPQVVTVEIQAVCWNQGSTATVARALKRRRDASARVPGIAFTGVDVQRYRTCRTVFPGRSFKSSEDYHAAFD